MSIPFIRKYCPENTGDIIAQDEQMSILKTFIENFKAQKKNAMIIHGPSGCGKTSSVYTLANELNYEIVEMNASDFRTKDQINAIAGAATQQMSLFGNSKIILIDEMDGISGRNDYGGIPALVKVIQDSSFPIIITANNPYPTKFSSIRNKSELLQFKELEAEDIFNILKDICIKENIKYEEEAIKMLARRSGGDARASVNDLEILAVMGDGITKNVIDELSERNKTDSIITALLKIFKTKDPNIAVSAFNNVEEDFDQRMLWLDENLPKEYTNPKDLARAYDKLSRADVFKGRIRRWQHWGFLRYVDNLMTAGVAVSKDKKYKFTAYKPTGRILKMYWAKIRNAKKKAIAGKIAEKTHTSTKQVLKNIDYFKMMFQNKEMGDKIAEELDLAREEVEWLKK